MAENANLEEPPVRKAGGQPKVVVVVGCTRGLGRAIFEWFARADGFSVAGCGTNEAELQSLREAYPLSLVGAVDVREEAAASSWLAAVASKHGSIDLLICSAGVLTAPRPLSEVSEADWAKLMEVNVLGTARMLRHGVPLLRAPGAVAVLISSRYGRSVVSGQGAYSATKWATESIAKTLALELRPRGVAVVSLDPGVVDTEILRACCPGPEGAEWCSRQRSPADFAATAAPFIQSLTLADTGRNLTCPGSPASYFETGVPYKDRPAWANGFGSFVRARDDSGQEEQEPQAPKKKRRAFISGVMLGSKRELKDASKDLAPQDYRGRMAEIIRRVDPEIEVVEPLNMCHEWAQARGKTIEEVSKSDALVCELFNEVVAIAGRCDVVISNLPEASLGAAAEMWEAKKAGKRVLTISPMKDNWLIRTVTDHNFADLHDFDANLKHHMASA